LIEIKIYDNRSSKEVSTIFVPFQGERKPMAREIHLKRTGKKLGIILLGMILFLLISMWIKGVPFKSRIFMALLAGLSAWMGIVSLVIWLWKETRQDDHPGGKG
jgi:hypothetical protein